MSLRSTVYGLRLAVCATVLLLTGCNRGEAVKFLRLEQLLFTTPTNQLPEAMKTHQEEYTTELISFYPDEPEFVHMTQDFVSDPVTRNIFHITDSLYHDFSDIERQLGRALARAYKLCPDMPHVERFYTMVAGDFNYNFRVYSNCSDLCVVLDNYALGAMEKYQYFGMPQYIVRSVSHEYIVPDCMYVLGGLQCKSNDGELSLLDYAIIEGKKLYFIEQTIPGIADTILLRYTADQMAWMKDNIEQVWGWFIQNKLLYSTDIGQFHNIIDDAPHTNAFGQSSAPRTTAYIGLQIVNRYMKKSGATMQQLFDNTDSRAILTTSGWRP